MMKQHETEIGEVGQLAIDFKTRTARISGHEIRLTNLNFRTLEYLFWHKHEAYISREALVEFLWPNGDGPQAEGEVRLMANIMVDKTRRNIAITQKQNGLPRTTYIHTVWADAEQKGFHMKVENEQEAESGRD